MTKSLLGGSAAIATALLTATTLFYTPPLAAETVLASQEPVQQQKPAQEEKRVATPPAPLQAARGRHDPARGVPRAGRTCPLCQGTP